MYIPGLELHQTGDLEEAAKAEVLLLVVPAQHLRAVLEQKCRQRLPFEMNPQKLDSYLLDNPI